MNMMTLPPSDVAVALAAAARARILILDGAMGTQIQELPAWTRRTFAGQRLRLRPPFRPPQKGNNDLLILTQPDAIEEIHLPLCHGRRRHRRDEHLFLHHASRRPTTGWKAAVFDLNRAGRAARAPGLPTGPPPSTGVPRFVAGALGPTNRTASISPM
jgi:5-methyltetrahydrofolate--homocysteine methyltransferase